MALTLRVTSFHSQALGADSTKVFGAQGGDIGRALDNDWVLPDPEKFVSSHHARVVCRNGAFFLQDTSTNGTFLNGSPQPIGNNLEQQLHHGDRLQIADYEIVVELDAAGQGVTGPTGASIPGWQQQQTGPSVPGWQPQNPTGPSVPGWQPQDSSGPDDILNIFDETPPAPAQNAWVPPAPDHASFMDQNFIPPTPQPAPPQDGNLIPENWDETGFAGASPPAPAPQDTLNQTRELPSPAFRPAVPPVSGADVTDRQASVAMLQAAGLDQAKAQAACTPANLVALGQILAVVTQGMIDVLAARSAIKSQFRVPVTTMRAIENNALKSSATATEALVNLLITHNPAYLGAVDSFAEGFEDIKAHQVALMAGMRAAFNSMFKRFDPERLEERFNKRRAKSRSVLRLAGSGQYWDMYKDLFDEMTQDADANFQRLFGDEFARAYEEQLQRLTSGRRMVRARS